MAIFTPIEYVLPESKDIRQTYLDRTQLVRADQYLLRLERLCGGNLTSSVHSSGNPNLHTYCGKLFYLSMTYAHPLTAALLTCSLTGCGQTEATTTLNERVFDARGALVGGGCSYYGFGDRAPETSVLRATPGIVVKQSGDGGPVRVKVTTTSGLAERVYDEAFFTESRKDFFSVKNTEGEEWQLRYWGAPKAGPDNGCTPLDQDAPE